jgi:hypothetical protein
MFWCYSNGGSHVQYYFSVDEQCAVRVLAPPLTADSSFFVVQSVLSVIEADGTAVANDTAVHRVPIHNGQRVSRSLSIYVLLQYR